MKQIFRYYLILLIFLAYPVFAVPVTETSGSVNATTVNNTTASNNTSTNDIIDQYTEEAQCYKLPYGTLGFITHVLTFYTMVMLQLKRQPLLFWKKINESEQVEGLRDKIRNLGLWNGGIMVFKFFFTTIPAVVSMSQCSHHWQIEGLVGMKLALSLTSTFNAGTPSWYWLFLYAPGLISGMAGAMSITLEVWSQEMFLLCVFAVSLVIVISLGLWWLYEDHRDKTIPFSVVISNTWGKDKKSAKMIFCYYIPGFIVLWGSLWTDWVLAIATGNLFGYPFEGSAKTKGLWILYFVGKRLSLLISIFDTV